MEIINDVLDACRALFAPGQVAELRILEIPGQREFKYNAAGWFNDWEALAAAAQKYNVKGPSGIYVTINPLHQACLARSNNQLIDRLRDTSSDRDVLRRAWLPIDLDPVRPSGVSATLGELEAARNMAGTIAAWLEQEFGFPKGLRAHSGNGVHLLYRIDLPNDDESRNLVKDALAALATRFDDDTVHVDKALHNASRILKLWGTVTRKGQHMPDRPHRQSRLWTRSAHADVAVVATDALKGLTALLPRASRATRPARAAKAVASSSGETTNEHWFDLDAWIARHGIEVVRTETFDGTGVRHILAHCLFDPAHVRTSACLGRAPSGVIFYKCQHESCADKNWHAVKAHVEELGTADAPPREKVEEGEHESPWALAADFIDHEYTADELGRITLRRHRETFYAYNNNNFVYQALSYDHMRAVVTRWLGENGYSTAMPSVRNLLNAVCSRTTVPEQLEIPFHTSIHPETMCALADPQPYNRIVLQNGILDLDRVLAGEAFASCLMNHSSEWFSTNALPFAFPTNELDAQCVRWLAFLDEVLEGDAERIALIQEMFGYCFWRDMSLEAFFILQGRGNNGKSTILEILQELLGRENVTNLSLDQFADPVLRAELYQKDANICDDLPEMERVEEGLIKRITSGQPIVARRLYKGALHFRPRCKLIFSTNPLPRFTDATLGVWRRMHLIPFEYVVPPNKVDIHLRAALQAELPGIFVWALEGAVRLVRQRRFTKAGICERARREYQLSCFPVLTFLEECTEASGSVRAKLLWETYRDWCRDCGLTKTKPLHSFVKDVIGFLPNIQYPRVRTGMASMITLHGICLRSAIELNYDARTPPEHDYQT